MAKTGNGTFQWNTAGWFGSQLGATCWLLIMAIGLMAQSNALSIVLLAGFVVPNILGTFIWTRRDRVDPYAAIQLLLAIILVSTLIVFLVCDARGQLQWLDQRITRPSDMYKMLLIYPLLMGIFYFINRRQT